MLTQIFDTRLRSFQDRRSALWRTTSIISLILLILVSGCSRKRFNADTTSVEGGNSKDSANLNSRVATPPPSIVEFKEPERYNLSMTISAQVVAGTPSSMATQQFAFAKLGSDRRWSFTFAAPLGHAVYLEKSGLRYVVFLDQNQYVEIAPDALGFQPGAVLTPLAIAESVKPGSQYEELGFEPVNGRTAMKYRITGSGDAPKRTEGTIFVDHDTSLPLRYEFTAAAMETVFRVIVEARDVQLNPDRLQFDVPAGMKKITPQEAKSRIDVLARSLRFFSDVLAGKLTTSQAPIVIESSKNRNASLRKNANAVPTNR